jgi:putative ATP-binding cassette transporter
LWDSGVGRVCRPGFDQILFLSERPYLPPGTLREGLIRTGSEGTVTDDQILATLRDLGIESVVKRAGGLDRENDWGSILSQAEQQLLTCARVLFAGPQFALFDRVGARAGPALREKLLRAMTARSIAYITFSEGLAGADLFDAVLELPGDGSWIWRRVGDGGEVSSAGGT